jgi:hypothetical protein
LRNQNETERTIFTTHALTLSQVELHPADDAPLEKIIKLSLRRAFKTGIPKTGIPGSRTIFQNRNFGIDLAQNRHFSVLSNHTLNSILLTYFESVFQ